MSDLQIIHDSHREVYRRPFGAVCCGTEIQLKLASLTDDPIDQVWLLLQVEGGPVNKLPMQQEKQAGGYSVYLAETRVTEEPGLLWYCFEIHAAGQLYYYGNNSNRFGGVGVLSRTLPPFYQITVYDEKAVTPVWYKKAVMYQIFVDRFCNGSDDGKVLNPKKNSFIYGNWADKPVYLKDPETGGILRWDFFGGNLQGVISKLPYLKELGVDVLYLNPIFEAPSNHKYDTGDYKKIDAMFGDIALFGTLCAKAREMGISVILDGVFSHTGSDSIYFNRYGNYPGIGAYQSQSSPYYGWYRFCGNPDSYECWWGINTLPNVEEMNPSYIDFVITGEESVIKYWMKQGAKGWRLDVADELPDAFITLVRQAMKETDPESVLIGEVWEDASNKISYGKRRSYLQGSGLDSVMNYPFRSILLDFFLYKHDAAFTETALASLYENYPPYSFYSSMNLIGSHDVPRVLTLLGEAPDESAMTQRRKEQYVLPDSQRNLAVARLKLAVLIQMTFPGVPCVYYGDEAGVEGYRDPLNRSTYPWGAEDKDLLAWYRLLIATRKRHDALSVGSWQPVFSRGDVLGYLRRIVNQQDVFGNTADNGTFLILINRSQDKRHGIRIDLPGLKVYGMRNLLADAQHIPILDQAVEISLEPLEGALYRME